MNIVKNKGKINTAQVVFRLDQAFNHVCVKGHCIVIFSQMEYVFFIAVLGKLSMTELPLSH